MLRLIFLGLIVFLAGSWWPGYWVLAGDPFAGEANQDMRIQDRFPDYQPKLTPDTVLDYRPGLAGRLSKLPPAALEALAPLLRILDRQQRLARENPGHKYQGRIALGADPVEYRPSDEELLASEIGRRIRQVVASETPEKVAEVLAQAGINITEITFYEITFRHVDVMGSGRFYYAGFPVRTRVNIKK